MQTTNLDGQQVTLACESLKGLFVTHVSTPNKQLKNRPPRAAA